MTYERRFHDYLWSAIRLFVHNWWLGDYSCSWVSALSWHPSSRESCLLPLFCSRQIHELTWWLGDSARLLCCLSSSGVRRWNCAETLQCAKRIRLSSLGFEPLSLQRTYQQITTRVLIDWKLCVFGITWMHIQHLECPSASKKYHNIGGPTMGREHFYPALNNACSIFVQCFEHHV